MRSFALGILCLVLAPVFAWSQGDFPRAEVFGGYSYLNADLNKVLPRKSFNGWEASITVNALKWIGAEGDFSGYYKNLGDVGTLAGIGPVGVNLSAHDYGFVGGPRVNVKPAFVHALFGVDRLTGSALGLSVSQNSFAGALGGGVEIPVASHFAVRGSTDYVFTRHNVFGGSRVTQNNVRASGGIVYMFGHTGSNASGQTHAGTTTAPRPSMPVSSLGVSVTTTDENRGAEIVDVMQGGVAELAGLHRGDILTSVDGKTVSTPMELAAALQNRAPGSQVRLGYMFRSSALGYFSKETVLVLGSNK